MAGPLFITLEGLDGVGKTTQLERLVTWLQALGRPVRVTAEPAGTALGEAIDGWLKRPGAEAPVPRAEALLFLAARAQHVEQVIRPALAAGETVVCSRFTHSTLAYQCYGLGLDQRQVRIADSFARGGTEPDLVLVLTAAVGQAEARRQGRDGGAADRIEARDEAFRQRVAGGFAALAEAEPERVKLIAAEGSPDEVAAAVLAAVEPLVQ